MFPKKYIEALPLNREQKTELLALLCRPRHKGGNPLKGKLLLRKLLPDHPLVADGAKNKDSRRVRSLLLSTLSHALKLARTVEDKPGETEARDAVMDLMDKAIQTVPRKITDFTAAADAIDELAKEAEKSTCECLKNAAGNLHQAAKLARNMPEEAKAEPEAEAAAEPRRRVARAVTETPDEPETPKATPRRRRQAATSARKSPAEKTKERTAKAKAGKARAARAKA